MRSEFRRLSILAVSGLLALPMVAHAQIRTFTAYLNGASEDTPNNSPALGQAWVTFDQALSTLRVQVQFFGLTTGNTAAHIHCCLATPFTGTAGVATSTPTFTGFPTGATSGWYDHTFNLLDNNSWNPAFITAQGSLFGAYTTFVTGLGTAGSAYVNIHTPTYPAGEIRGFLQLVPEPSTYALMASGLIAIGLFARKRRNAR